MSVRPSVRKEKLAPNWRIFMKLYKRVLFENLSKKSIFIKIWQEYRIIYINTIKCIWPYLSQFFLEWKMWKHIVKQSRPHVKIWYMQTTRWITVAKNTYFEYIMIISILPHQWIRECNTMVCVVIHAFSVFFIAWTL